MTRATLEAATWSKRRADLRPVKLAMGKILGDDDIAAEIRHLSIVVGIAIALGVPALLILGNTDWAQDLSMAYPTALVGVAGATSNNVRRLYRVRKAEEDSLKVVDHRLVIAQIYLSAIIGAVFAAVAYALFLSGILQGEFFPEFECASDRFISYEKYASCNPTTNGDAAMVIVWGFVAGFAERFVPNVIDGIIPGASNK